MLCLLALAWLGRNNSAANTRAFTPALTLPLRSITELFQALLFKRIVKKLRCNFPVPKFVLDGGYGTAEILFPN